jgi:2-keto-3-deoxy-L-rhamnonate aldolase RhmA
VYIWQQRRNRFKETIDRGEAPLIAWMTIPWPPLAEIFGSCGVDAVVIDLEHTTTDLETVEHIITACDAAGVTPFVRPPVIDAHLASRLLDAGAMGLVFADVRTKEEAEYAVACTNYPPIGRRGWGGAHTRYAMWQGVTADTALREEDEDKRGIYSQAYVDKTNRDVLAFLIVESIEGAENIEEIAAVPGIAGITFGWADYAVQTSFSLPETEAAARRVYDACKANGVGMSIPLSSVDKLPPYDGCHFACGIDSLIVSAAVKRAVDSARERMAAVLT